MVVQKAVIVHMITARMDTMTAAALSTDSVTTTLIITVIAPCLLPLAQGAVPLGEALRHQTHILTLEFEILSLSLILQDVTCTEMTEDDVLIEHIITVGVDRLIPHSQGTLPHNGPRGKPPKLLIPLKEPLCPQGEARDLDPAVDPRAPILSAAPAAQAAEVIQIAAQVMDLEHVLFSRPLHTRLLSPLWCSILKSRVEALELKCKTYQCAQQTQV